MQKAHSFHIPVMGIAYTIDTPLKVSQYGIDSVISLVDDKLMEKMRKMYCLKFKIPYFEITDKIKDFRAERITSYLNLINDLARKKFEKLKGNVIDTRKGIKQYFSMLPENVSAKREFKNIHIKYGKLNFNFSLNKAWINLRNSLKQGSIDVNIMTKLDKENYIKGEKQPIEFNDAHAALRGFAKSNLNSSIVLSAGMNARLYSYFEEFEDFYPNEYGDINKRIILKVSDYRSALIQGKIFAKKGIWISEYRIESGLNCGGHAFATEGNLMGPILSEFKENRQSLIDSTYEILTVALKNKNKTVPKNKLDIKITAQGGVGTPEEHDFLIDHYGLDSVGWGSPFLLVPEATTIDKETINKLAKAKEDDLYLSNISPLGVPFNSLKGNTKDIEKQKLIDKNKPGSVCPKKYLALNNDYTEKSICTASRLYQRLKIKELDAKNLSGKDYKEEYDTIVDKSCICVGLGTSALLANDLDTKKEGAGVSVCPGPNIAYFSKEISLTQITDYIYGRSNDTSIITKNRPNMFVKELSIYVDYLKNKIKEIHVKPNRKQEKYLNNFVNNLNGGISYYRELFNNMRTRFLSSKETILKELNNNKAQLSRLNSEIQKLKEIKPVHVEKV